MDIQEIAFNTFTISSLLLTASIVILSHAWKRLNIIISTMPSDKRRVRINLRSISDANEHSKYECIRAQFISCIFLVLSLFCAVIVVFIMSSVMVGDTTGIYAEDNFEIAVVAMRIGVFSLFMGILVSGFVYVEDFYALFTGKPSITKTDLRNLPHQEIDKAKSNFLFLLFPGFFIIIVLIELFIPYNQWIKMGIALLAITGLFIILRLCYIAYRKIWNKEK